MAHFISFADPLRGGVEGEKYPSGTVLIKIRRHRKTGKVKYQTIGFVSNTIKFTKLMDQQFLPSSIYPNVDDVEEEEVSSRTPQHKNMRHLEAIPRPFIHRNMEHSYFQNLYGENIQDSNDSGFIAAKKERRKLNKAANAQNAYSGVFIKYGDLIPQDSPFDIEKVVFRGDNVERAKKMKMYLQMLFDERPIWSKKTIENMEIMKDSKFLLKKLLVYYAYNFMNGPWRVNKHIMPCVVSRRFGFSD